MYVCGCLRLQAQLPFSGVGIRCRQKQAVLLPGDSLVPPVKGVASTTTSYSQALTVLCSVVVIIGAGMYYSSTLINSSVWKRETNLV